MTLASSGQSSTDGQAEAAAALQRVRDKVDEISRNRSEEQVAKEITAWKQREPKSPEPYIIAANYYLRKTLQPIGINIYSTESGTPPSCRPQDGQGSWRFERRANWPNAKPADDS
jgi:hypothetical protein